MYDMTINGHMLEEELQVIERWASAVPENGVIVEVGSLFGRSAVAWANSCSLSVNVYCVDPFYDPRTDTDYSDEFYNNTNDIENLSSIVAVCPYFKYSKYIDKPADVYFVDATHSNPNDWHIILFGLKNLKTGGLLCGHDYVEEWPDVVENVKKLEQMLGKSVTTYPNTALWSFEI